MKIVAVTSFRAEYCVAGRRETIHQVTVIDGERTVGTGRCNIDDTDEEWRPRPVETVELEGAARRRFCGWCFEKGES